MAYINFQPSDYFNTKIYTGNNTSTHAITGVGFQPDWTWIKVRNTADSHRIYDAVRGASNHISSNVTNAQSSSYPLTSFDSDGFTIGSSDISVNGNYNYASWNWKANGQGSANTDGSINTTYTSANTTSGFSICQWTGSGANATIGHGLGSAPKVVFIKNTSSAENWVVGHSSIGFTKFLQLNTTAAEATATNRFNDTAPTSSVFSVGTETQVNNSGDTMIAYCFAEKKGFSKFGSYTGNGSTDGTFVYTGFKPAFVMIKSSSLTGESWFMQDNKRNTFNVVDDYLLANSSNAEATTDLFDFTSTGFKMRNSGSGHNSSGATYIYMCFAEEPLVSSNDIPATAR